MINLHVLGLAHLPTVEADPVMACAYSQKIRRFCQMMLDSSGNIYHEDNRQEAQGLSPGRNAVHFPPKPLYH